MAEDKDDAPEGRSLRERLENAANTSLVAAATGALGAGAEAALLGAASGPALLALEALWGSVRALRAGNAARVVAEAASRAGMSPEAFAEAVGASAERAILAGEVIDAAMRTAFEEKLTALAVALSVGVTDNAVIDRELLVVRTLADLDLPHVQVLERMVNDHPGGMAVYRGTPGAPRFDLPGWSQRALVKALPTHAEVLMALIGALERHALVEVVPVNWVKRANEELAWNRGSHGSYERDWRATELGEWFLDRIRPAVAPET